jgi:ribosomal-protein-alanine N-acetyltransferase
VLRALTPEDADALLGIFADADALRYWARPAFTGRNDVDDLLREIADGLEDGELLEWGIVRPQDDRVLGTATLHRIDAEHRRAELGYALARAAWGRGYATEALRAVVRYGFERLDLLRIEADVDPRNVASIRVLERLGFRHEGHLRARWIVGGEIQDSWIYGKLRTDP